MTSENEKYRTGLRRWAAAFIDGLVFIPLDLIDRKVRGSLQYEYYGLFWWITFFTFITVLYSVGLHYGFGQTLGKMAMRVKVVDVSEQKDISLKQAILRDIVYIILEVAGLIYLALLLLYQLPSDNDVLKTFDSLVNIAAGFWVLLELISLLTNNKRRAVHDFIAGTVVVKVAE